MSLINILCQQPVFKNGVLFEFKDTSIEIRHGNQGCAIAVLPEDKPEVSQLLRLLQVGGFSWEQLAQQCPGIQEQVPELLSEFAARGLITEHKAQVELQGVTGRQFYRELCRFLVRFKRRFPPSPFSQKMLEGTISRNQLIGYVLDSYHITHLCPKLLAPSLTHHESPTTHKLLQEFFVSELNHDRLIEKSLKSVGIGKKQLTQMQPLPMTFAMCSSLGVFAHQHPLSFKAALMVFEEDDQQFHQLFKQNCEALGLPPQFYQPVLLHARINEEGDHGEITADLFGQVPYISPQEQWVVRQNIAILVESSILRTHEILDYYGNPHNPIPRCFDLVH